MGCQPARDEVQQKISSFTVRPFSARIPDSIRMHKRTTENDFSKGRKWILQASRIFGREGKVCDQKWFLKKRKKTGSCNSFHPHFSFLAPRHCFTPKWDVNLQEMKSNKKDRLVHRPTIFSQNP
ncbi:hypothetical protein CEXT_637721 [Caerostris extrusa]|uniref:Uncharacterized protein n=1 Tax=Caerostris extrusa TaxID=172846 RepID=A0AAV4MH37_CAEEX|nr:hypothetical protein CEXT_637721 [Caerostris extrusa]